ncbi:hypothetical protein BZG36_03079 [Bifiguratus adelaidae]|uniref:Methyltransferase type 11 domain-containing protein n=1 Tax=Bifiguratus adelaidae TaxID=1938954 RepID=A0A261XZF7_9FUNG|nr:hypothetical protein BZG36_03079 [Bifiguratus adelaidae]
MVEDALPYRKDQETVAPSVDAQSITKSSQPTNTATTETRDGSEGLGSMTSPNGNFRYKSTFVFNEQTRRFHNEEDAPYVLPNDDDEFSESHFMGIDLSAIFPETVRPPNCDFQKVNACKGLPFPPDNHFDFVYEHLLEADYTADNWTLVLSEIKRVTKSGRCGRIGRGGSDAKELRTSGPLFEDFMNTFIDALKAIDLDVTIGRRLSGLLRQCSDEVDAKISVDYRSPVRCGGRLGEMWASQLRVGFEAAQTLFESKYGKMTPEELKDRLDKALQECAEF